jgi:DNA-binding NtrC family response regulator
LCIVRHTAAAPPTISADVRVIAATNRDLKQAVAGGRFRADLYYRLNAFPIELPPLRERREDIPVLVNHFLQKYAASMNRPVPRVSAKALDVLMAHSWPGNVRELENAIKHALAFVHDNEITLDALPPRVATTRSATPQGGGMASGVEQMRNVSLRAFLRQKEKEYLEQAIEGSNGNKEEAARRLQISLATLYRKLPGDEKK